MATGQQRARDRATLLTSGASHQYTGRGALAPVSAVVGHRVSSSRIVCAESSHRLEQPGPKGPGLQRCQAASASARRGLKADRHLVAAVYMEAETISASR